MSEQAIAKVKAAAAEGKEVQFRRCADCGEVQGRIQAKDGSFKRWSKCGCPSPAKSGGGGVVRGDAATGVESGSSAPPPVDVGVQVDGEVDVAAGVDAPPAPDLPLHRDTVTRLPKKAGE